MAVFKSLLLALCLTLCLVANSNASDTKWAITDSLPSLYYSYGAYCDPAYLSNWTCGFCKHNPGTQVVGLLEDWLTSTFGYVAISGNEGMCRYGRGELFVAWTMSGSCFKRPSTTYLTPFCDCNSRLTQWMDDVTSNASRCGLQRVC